jgi:hypothetical protein
LHNDLAAGPLLTQSANLNRTIKGEILKNQRAGSIGNNGKYTFEG